MIQRVPASTLFPYTTLFRSIGSPSVHTNQDKAGGLFNCYEETEIAVCADYASGLRSLCRQGFLLDRKSTRLNSSHPSISYAVLCLKKKTLHKNNITF